MKKTIFTLSLAACVLGLLPSAHAETVTYAEDVAPIFRSSCEQCHRPGEAVPMTLLSYEEVRPWAKSIKKVVEAREMPPWFADPEVGHWKNDMRLKDEEIQKIVAWVDAGVPMGDPSKLPPKTEFSEGWKIGEPDMIFEMPKEMVLAADLVDEYKYVMIPTNLGEDRWIQAAESRPGNTDVVHHIIVFVQESGKSGRGRESLSGGLGGYAPGIQPSILPPGQAMYLPAGATLILQMHYNKEAGLVATDRSSVGVKFATAPVTKRRRTDFVGDRTFAIPPGEANHVVDAIATVDRDITVSSIMPHMHLRGKDMKVWAKYPDGRVEDILNVPAYDFNWQLGYAPAEPLRIPAGTQLFAQATFDNSTDNPNNPDPTAEVRWGLPTYAEMMFAFYTYTFDDEELNEVDPGARKTVASGL